MLLTLGTGCKPPGARAMLDGREHLNANRPQQAAAAFEKATRLLPEDWRTWNHLGLALHRGGKHAAALLPAGEQWADDGQTAERAVDEIGRNERAAEVYGLVFRINAAGCGNA